jgi:hypothetical protein
MPSVIWTGEHCQAASSWQYRAAAASKPLHRLQPPACKAQPHVHVISQCTGHAVCCLLVQCWVMSHGSACVLLGYGTTPLLSLLLLGLSSADAQARVGQQAPAATSCGVGKGGSPGSWCCLQLAGSHDVSTKASLCACGSLDGSWSASMLQQHSAHPGYPASAVAAAPRPLRTSPRRSSPPTPRCLW